jgi:hypothetical protein
MDIDKGQPQRPDTTEPPAPFQRRASHHFQPSLRSRRLSLIQGHLRLIKVFYKKWPLSSVPWAGKANSAPSLALRRASGLPPGFLNSLAPVRETVARFFNKQNLPHWRRVKYLDWLPLNQGHSCLIKAIQGYSCYFSRILGDFRDSATSPLCGTALMPLGPPGRPRRRPRPSVAFLSSVALAKEDAKEPRRRNVAAPSISPVRWQFMRGVNEWGFSSPPKLSLAFSTDWPLLRFLL